MGGVEQDGGERGGHDTSVLQTNTVLLHRHKVLGGLLLPCMQRVVSVEVYAFGGFLKGRQPTSQVVYTRFQVSYVRNIISRPPLHEECVRYEVCTTYVQRTTGTYVRLSLTRVTKSYFLALGTTQISSFFTKH